MADGDIDLNWVIIIIVVVVVVWLFLSKGGCSDKEGLSGYGVTSSLAFNNRMAYCDPGYGIRGGSYSGGCFLPHRVIV